MGRKRSGGHCTSEDKIQCRTGPEKRSMKHLSGKGNEQDAGQGKGNRIKDASQVLPRAMRESELERENLAWRENWGLRRVCLSHNNWGLNSMNSMWWGATGSVYPRCPSGSTSFKQNENLLNFSIQLCLGRCDFVASKKNLLKSKPRFWNPGCLWAGTLGFGWVHPKVTRRKFLVNVNNSENKVNVYVTS